MSLAHLVQDEKKRETDFRNSNQDRQSVKPKRASPYHHKFEAKIQRKKKKQRKKMKVRKTFFQTSNQNSKSVNTK